MTKIFELDKKKNNKWLRLEFSYHGQLSNLKYLYFCNSSEFKKEWKFPLNKMIILGNFLEMLKKTV